MTFLLGLAVGAAIGFFIASLCAVSKIADLEGENHSLKEWVEYWEEQAEYWRKRWAEEL